MAMYDNKNTFEKSFDNNYISAYLLQAQWAEFVELKKIIHEIYKKIGQPIHLLDIGIGSARVAKHLSDIKEIWQLIAHYDGIDNAASCIELSNTIIKENNIEDKVNTYLFDSENLHTWDKKYHLIICTWFTPGNFYPNDFSFETYATSKQKLDLTKNDKFERIFSSAYSLLEPYGALVLGACYHDNNNTRLIQEDSYKKMGMTIITNEYDSFTATKEGFWSQRFTIERLYQYLHFAPLEKITITNLDTYAYGMQVRIRK